MPQRDGLTGEFENADRTLELERVNDELRRQLKAAKDKDTRFIDAALKGAADAVVSLGPLPAVPPPVPDRRHAHVEAALWHLTDWQGAKVTEDYDTRVMHERVRHFVKKADRLTRLQRQDHPVKDLAIAFGGDMIEGLFNFPTQPFEIDATLFEQWVTVSNLIAEVVRAGLATHERVTVVPEWGNHGRIGSKRDTVPKNDNFDRMCYHHARTIVGDDPRLTWQDCDSDIQRLEMGNYRAIVIHGDEPGRSGYVSPMQMVNHINRWRSGAYKWAFTDAYIGHYHRHAEEPLADGVGHAYWTGSTESSNRYALEGMAASAEPSQRVHFVDLEKGRVTAQYQVFLQQ